MEPRELGHKRSLSANDSGEDDSLPMRQQGLKVVKGSIRKRAQSASNFIAPGAPPNEILTDERGVVLSVTPDFLNFTGYAENEMLGRKCNFLQGEQTDPQDVEELRGAMSRQSQTSVVILNYKKDGVPFWNILTIIPEFKPNTHEIDIYHGEVIGIPIPPRMRGQPKLCLDDALALISVFSSVPRALEFSKDETEEASSAEETLTSESASVTSCHIEEYDSGDESAADGQSLSSEKETEGRESPSLYKHQNYAERFSDVAKGYHIANNESSRRSDYYFVAETTLPTMNGRYRVRAYRNEKTGAEPLAIINGSIEGKQDVVVRVHDQCLTSEIFGSLKCDCKQQLDFALSYIKGGNQDHVKAVTKEGEKSAKRIEQGIVIYLPQEGRGIGLANKIAAYAMQESGLDTVDANRSLGLPDDAREYDSVKDILQDLGVKSIRLLTNNPRKIKCLKTLGVKITERLECVVIPNSNYSMGYVHAKAQRMGHMINVTTLSSGFTKQQQHSHQRFSKQDFTKL